MDTLDVSVGQEPAYAEIHLADQFGDPTEVFDEAAGISWSSSDESVAVFLDDDDERTLDRPIRFVGPGEVTLRITLDGAPGPAERELILESPRITVHEAGAFSGEVKVAFRQVEPPADPA